MLYYRSGFIIFGTLSKELFDAMVYVPAVCKGVEPYEILYLAWRDFVFMELVSYLLNGWPYPFPGEYGRGQGILLVAVLPGGLRGFKDPFAVTPDQEVLFLPAQAFFRVNQSCRKGRGYPLYYPGGRADIRGDYQEIPCFGYCPVYLGKSHVFPALQEDKDSLKVKECEAHGCSRIYPYNKVFQADQTNTPKDSRRLA